MKKVKVEYVGRDLEAMDFAENYHEWIFTLIKPFLGSDLVEVGAGTGAFSRLLLRSNPRSLTLIEPSAMFERLSDAISATSTSTEVKLFQNVFSDTADVVKAIAEPDSITYINVLEHIDDDQRELNIAYRTLKPGGRICIFVPAHPFLYSEFDRYLGHFRRYRKSELKEKCLSAGFRIVLARNFDLPGILPWFLKYCLFRSKSMEKGLTAAYDRLVVPVSRRIESMIPPPIGKNFLIIGEKAG